MRCIVIRNYEELYKVYDHDWGKFSLSYISLIEKVYELFPQTIISSVLDVGCGTGNLVAELTSEGFNARGLDLSPEMIAKARKKVDNIDFRVDDIRTFKYEQSFDLITCSFDVINYITDRSEMVDAFLNIASHLKETGYLLFDFNTLRLYEKKHYGTIRREFQEKCFNQILNYDSESKLASTIFEFNDSEREEHVQRAYTIDEVMSYLTQAGLEVCVAYKDLKFNIVDEEALKIFMIAKKSDR